MGSKIFISAIIATGAIMLIASPSTAQDINKLMYDSCIETPEFSDSVCNCIIERANNDLNDKQLDLLVASITDDQKKIASAQSNISPDEMMTVINFMTVTPAQCQG